MEPEGDRAARLAQDGALGAPVLVADKRPLVQSQAVGRRVPGAIAALVSNVRLGRAQVVPVGRRLGALSDHGHEVAVDAEQLLDGPLRFLVAALAEVLEARVSVRVREVQRPSQ